MKSFKKIFRVISGTIVLLLFGNIIYFYTTKVNILNILKNSKYTFSIYQEKTVAGRGTTLANYEYSVNQILYRESIALGTFSNSNPSVGESYFVVYNSKNPKESICFLNLKVPDSLIYLSGKSLDKIPIESYQKSVNSFFLESLHGSLVKYFPPYYSEKEINNLINK